MSGAVVIPFPFQPANRLASALSRLAEAQAAQRTALSDFRSALGGLRLETGKLKSSVSAWDGQVRRLGQDIAAAGEATRELERTAARM